MGWPESWERRKTGAVALPSLEFCVLPGDNAKEDGAEIQTEIRERKASRCPRGERLSKSFL